jgi:GT2 family glycosyltransferase
MHQNLGSTKRYRPAIDLSIIIVNWNSIAYLGGCVASIFEHTRHISFEVIVVDNASPAGDADALEQQFPQVTVIKNAENLGFAGANNIGFMQSSGQYVLFLNPDTKLVGSAIEGMVQGITSLPNAGAVGCKLLNEDLSIQTSCIQTFPTILNQLLDSDWLRQRWPNSRLWGTRALFSTDGKPAFVEVISGACMMVRRDVFEKVGLFSEDYFMYAEDLDLCYKMAKAGYSIYYIGNATVIHYGGRSSEPESATSMKWRSITRFCKRYHGTMYALTFRIAMASSAVGRLGAIAIMRFLGNTLETRRVRWSASTKWRLVLRTVLTPSGRPCPIRATGKVASEG